MVITGYTFSSKKICYGMDSLLCSCSVHPLIFYDVSVGICSSAISRGMMAVKGEISLNEFHSAARWMVTTSEKLGDNWVLFNIPMSVCAEYSFL